MNDPAHTPLIGNDIVVLGLVALGAAAYGACLFMFGMRPRDFSRRAAE